MGESEQSPAARPRGDRRSRTLTKVGFALIVAGAAVLGYVGWELYGTTWLAQREQGRTVEATERLWSSDGGRSASKEKREQAKDVIALIRIPALGEEYVIPAYRGTDDDTLERGFGIFDDSPRPGAVGNFALGGHRITHGEPLREMPSLEAGDEIIVETADATYRYALDTAGDSRSVGTDAVWVTETPRSTPRPASRCLTSWVQPGCSPSSHARRSSTPMTGWSPSAIWSRETPPGLQGALRR